MTWNLLITAQRFESRQAREQLKDLCNLDVEGTPFRDVMVAYCSDPRAAFETIKGAMTAPLRPGAPQFLPAFSRIVPLEEVFAVTPDGLLAELIKRVVPFAARIVSGSSFAVRVERRGSKGTLNSSQLERQVAEQLYNQLAKAGPKPIVNLEDPDYLLTVQILGNECGIGLIDRAMRTTYPFVRLR